MTAHESALARTARRAARDAVRRRGGSGAPTKHGKKDDATAPGFSWQRLVREEARAARAHRDEIWAALRELDDHLDMGDALTRRLTLFPGSPIR